MLPCAMCLASGPGFIRPTRKTIASLNSSQRAVPASLNEEIASYKIVKTYIPAGTIGKKLFPSDHAEHVTHTLKLPACYECHNGQTCVRAALNYDHVATINFQDFTSVGKEFYLMALINCPNACGICLRNYQESPSWYSKYFPGIRSTSLPLARCEAAESCDNTV